MEVFMSPNFLTRFFDSIKNEASPIKNVDSINLTYGDLFFVYNTIVNKMKAGSGSLSVIFQNYAKSTDSLNHKLNLHYQKFDSQPELIMNNLNVSDLLFALYNSGFSTKKLTLNEINEDGEPKTVEIAKEDYVFNIGVSEFGKTGSITSLIASIESLIKNNIVTLELNCDGM
jgi:hypothetical protein